MTKEKYVKPDIVRLNELKIKDINWVLDTLNVSTEHLDMIEKQSIVIKEVCKRRRFVYDIKEKISDNVIITQDEEILKSDIYRVVAKDGFSYAMKRYPHTMEIGDFCNELEMHIRANIVNVAPLIIDYDIKKRYIVFELMKQNLFDVIQDNKGVIAKSVQNEIIAIFKGLDKIGVFHANPSPLNFMYDEFNKLKMIDFYYARPATKNKTNITTSPTYFNLKLRGFFPDIEIKQISKYI